MTVQVKICGLTNLDDAQCAVDAGADLLGFIFVPGTPRYVSASQAKTIVDGLTAGCAALPKLVGVFVDESQATVMSILEIVGLDYAQLHGSEPLSAVSDLSGRAFKALRPQPESTATLAADAHSYAVLGVPEGPRLLVDAFSPTAHGGTGQLVDWALAGELAAAIPGFMLAGGLTPDNVFTAVEAVNPWAVDTSSGVEVEPGRKNHDAVRRFVTAAKSAAA